MAVAVSHGLAEPSHAPTMSADVALRIAWMCWLTLLVSPFLMFLYVGWSLSEGEVLTRNEPLGTKWFIATMAYLCLAVPLSIFWRSHVFKAYWYGVSVEPRKYLIGMVSVWLTIWIGGILALFGCLASETLLPNLLPALVAFMMFTPLWPSGKAMLNPVGHADDPSIYEEPR